MKPKWMLHDGLGWLQSRWWWSKRASRPKSSATWRPLRMMSDLSFCLLHL